MKPCGCECAVTLWRAEQQLSSLNPRVGLGSHFVKESVEDNNFIAFKTFPVSALFLLKSYLRYPFLSTPLFNRDRIDNEVNKSLISLCFAALIPSVCSSSSFSKEKFPGPVTRAEPSHFWCRIFLSG